MNMTRQRFIHFALAAFCVCAMLTGCGYLKDDPVKESVIDARNLVGTCEIDISKLKDILIKEIPEQIDCLEQNIATYREFVILQDGELIGRDELKEFVTQYFATDVEELTNSIDLAFSLSSLVFNDSEEGVKVGNLDSFFKVIKITNRGLGKLNKIATDFDSSRVSLIDSRRAVKNTIQKFTNELKDAIALRGQSSSNVKFNIPSFIAKIQTSYDVLQTLDSKTLEGLLGLKKLFLGGTAEDLTRPEFFAALDKAPDFGKVLFSVIKGERASFIEDNDYLKMLREGITSIESQVFSHRQSEKILDQNLLNILIDYLAANEKDAKLYKKLAKTTRRNLLNEGTDQDIITYKELRNIIVFAKSFIDGNLFYSRFKGIIKERETWVNEDWKKAKRLAKAEFELLQKKLVDSFSNAFFLPQSFYVVDFIRDTLDITEFEVDNLDEYINLMSKAKMLLVGGSENVLTKNQLGEIINKSSLLSAKLFDASFYSNKSHNTRQLRKLFFDLSKDLSDLLTNKNDTLVISIRDLVRSIEKLMERSDLKAMIPSFEYVKEKVVGGGKSSLRVRDFRRISEMIFNYTSIVYYMDISYDLYRSPLSYKRKLTRLTRRTHPHLNDFSKEQGKKLKKRFEDIVFKFRIYRDKNGVQHYTDDYKRTKYGLIELAYVKYFVEELIKGFGSYDKSLGEYTMSMDQMGFSLKKLRPILESLGLWTQSPDTFARNIVLLSDLFQGNSNGSVTIDSFEGTEFFTLLFFAQNFIEKLEPILDRKCGKVTRAGVTGYDMVCYREKFYGSIFNEGKLARPLSKLAQYASTTFENDPEEFTEFHLAVEGFARDSSDDNVPMTKKDLILVFGALLNIESVFARFDQDFSNVLSTDELTRAFPVYEEALILISDGLLNDSNREFVPSTFYYIIENKKIPTKTQLGIYHYSGGYKDATGGRLNIGKLLFNMVQQ